MRLAAQVFMLMLVGCIATAQPVAPPPPPPNPYQPTLDRLDAMTSVRLTDWRQHAADLPHPEDPALDDSAWERAPLAGNQGAGNDMHWYRSAIVIPTAAGGKDLRGTRVELALRTQSPTVRVFLNGSQVARDVGRLLQPILVTQNATPGERMVVAVNATRLQDARLVIHYADPDPGAIRAAIATTFALLGADKENSEQHRHQLDAAVAALDFAALERGDQQAFTRSLAAAQEKFAPLRAWMQQFTVYAVGNSHIDMAWLWPWTETVEVVRDTFTTATQLGREYPDFTYAASTAQAFLWLEEKYPALFRQLQQRVKEGKWELVGGMWVEPDLNLPDGESLVRQLLYGTRYFKGRFGVDVNLGWNPDSFGYNWQLPQIYKRSGFDRFVTQKMSWNETTVFPHKLFWWQAPDGSRVLTYFPHRYNEGVDPVEIAGDIAAWAPATGFPGVLHLYGVGDHGGGPTRAMLDELERLRAPNAIFPRIQYSTAGRFFDELEKQVKSGALKPPVWNNELYLEYHRGCYTTQSETKKLIRESEVQLQNAEKFSSLAFLHHLPYPGAQLERSWRRVLFDHFHDIMPGSGIAVNYKDAAENLNTAKLEDGAVLRDSLHALAAQVNTLGEGTPFVIFNSLSWPRAASVVLEVPSPATSVKLEVRDAANRVLLSQPAGDAAGMTRLRVEVLLPALGYATVHVVPVAAARAAESSLKVTGNTLENGFLRMTLDPKTGCITSLIAKTANASDPGVSRPSGAPPLSRPPLARQGGIETLAPNSCGNLLQTFVDKPARQDAWEIKFDEQHWELTHPEEVTLSERGPLRAAFRIRHRFQNSTITQLVSLEAGSPRVEIETAVDWHEHHILLKAGVTSDAKAERATFEIPYGTIQRPTTRNTPAERAMFEVPALRWGDLSDNAHGVSLLNASKYGYDAVGSVLRVSLLRSATYPNGREDDPDAVTDQGHHEFTYALLPHAGDWKTGGTMRQGYELNYPALVFAGQTHAGPLPARHSFAQLEPANVILTVMKKAEDDDALLFRFYEFAGKPADVKLQLPASAAEAFETNLMEKKESALPLSADKRSVTVAIRPYEIRTLAVRFTSP